MFAIVEHEEQVTSAQPLDERFEGRTLAHEMVDQRRPHMLDERARLIQVGAINNAATVGEGVFEGLRDLHRQARLAAASWSPQRHKPLLGHEAREGLEILLASNEW